MKIRRILATAVAAAVTTPVVFLSATPAFADTKPGTTAEARNKKPTLDELRLAVTKAQAVYDAAVVADSDAQRAMDEFDKPGNPLSVARIAAKKASDEAAAAKVTADGELKKAQDAQAALPAEATQEQKDAAKKAVDDAQKSADEAKATAETKAAAYAAADKTYDDASVELSRKIGKAQKAKADALKALDAAKKELADAQEEPGEDDCVDDKNFVTTLTGPAKVTAGTSAVFNLRVTNKGKFTFDEVGGSALAYSMEDGEDEHFSVAWSSVNSPKWQTLDSFDEEEGFSSLSAVKPGGSFDFKLKVTVDAKAKAADAVLAGGGGYQNKDGACGVTDEGAFAGFAVVKPTKPAPGKDTDKGGSTTGGNGNTTQQGGSSNTSVTSGSTGGTLAKTGSGSATLPIGLAGGVAVVLGAGAMVLVRRRKAGADA
ncbi:LPXTG cell wall anchor domain-containing protein [Streptomyces sp. NBC_01268]|uniref:LPXTG cell wall anchor domain-containing protein n=1 Tax=Streptomyces sp. NBC_01268 TaxID=2903806 RepID=UPI002E2EC962|nr:LPXTG cell wall anchor domain-containing protein [Streptomyces sp. NBC_01268]